VLSRTKRWGFIMESCWVLLTGFAMPARGDCPELEDDNLKVTTAMMHSEAMAYNIGVQIPFFQNLPAPLLNLLVHHGAIGFDSDEEDEMNQDEDDVDDDENEDDERGMVDADD